jgi:hypothetical protein
MKPAYLGGVRGYQSAVYRPGMGWSGTESRRHPGRQPAVFKKNQTVRVSPLAVAYQRRPGLKTRAAIVASVASIAGMLSLVLVASAQF